MSLTRTIQPKKITKKNNSIADKINQRTCSVDEIYALFSDTKLTVTNLKDYIAECFPDILKEMAQKKIKPTKANLKNEIVKLGVFDQPYDNISVTVNTTPFDNAKTTKHTITGGQSNCSAEEISALISKSDVKTSDLQEYINTCMPAEVREMKRLKIKMTKQTMIQALSKKRDYMLKNTPKSNSNNNTVHNNSKRHTNTNIESKSAKTNVDPFTLHDVKHACKLQTKLSQKRLEHMADMRDIKGLHPNTPPKKLRSLLFLDTCNKIISKGFMYLLKMIIKIGSWKPLYYILTAFGISNILSKSHIFDNVGSLAFEGGIVTFDDSTSSMATKVFDLNMLTSTLKTLFVQNTTGIVYNQPHIPIYNHNIISNLQVETSNIISNATGLVHYDMSFDPSTSIDQDNYRVPVKEALQLLGVVCLVLYPAIYAAYKCKGFSFLKNFNFKKSLYNATLGRFFGRYAENNKEHANIHNNRNANNITRDPKDYFKSVYEKFLNVGGSKTILDIITKLAPHPQYAHLQHIINEQWLEWVKELEDIIMPAKNLNDLNDIQKLRIYIREHMTHAFIESINSLGTHIDILYQSVNTLLHVDKVQNKIKEKLNKKECSGYNSKYREVIEQDYTGTIKHKKDILISYITRHNFDKIPQLLQELHVLTQNIETNIDKLGDVCFPMSQK